MVDYAKLSAASIHERGAYHLVVETPGGANAKMKFDEDLQVFVFQKPLPLGYVYPFDWGFIPGTLAEDDDPLDAMVLSDTPTAVGIVIDVVPIGVIRLRQQERRGQREVQNDRVLVAPVHASDYADVQSLPKRVRDGLEAFFVATGKIGKEMVVVDGWQGPRKAAALIQRAAKAYHLKHS